MRAQHRQRLPEQEPSYTENLRWLICGARKAARCALQTVSYPAPATAFSSSTVVPGAAARRTLSTQNDVPK